MMENGIDRENLQKLATYLAYGELPKDVVFNMGKYTSESNEITATTCGTAGCAVGFAPFAGIEKSQDETFGQYSCRTLIDRDFPNAAWDWCFTGDWALVDNTPLGAAKRIQKLLNDGAPSDWLDNDPATVIDLYKDVEVLR